MTRKLFVTVLLSTLVCGSASAEPVKSGRLPDGRAYRMDQNGYRIIDELAELEVSVAELERQNTALIDEAADKQKLIDQLRQGKCGPAQIAETDLNKKTQNNLPPPAAVSCNSATEPFRQRISELENRLALQSETIKAKESSVRFGEQQSSALKNELETTKQQLALAPSLSSLEDLRDMNSRLETDNKRLETAIIEMQGKLAAAEQRSTQLATDLSEVRAAAESRAALASTRPAGTVPSDFGRAALATPPANKGRTIGDQVEVAEARREFKSQLGKIDSKIIERKRLLDSVQSRRLGVTMTVQPLRTADGRSLDALRLAVGSSFGDSDISSIRSGLAQIEKILDDDLGVFHRLGRI
jgi:DNA repair exonuclease SbcCD ATPase subunit